MTKPRKILIIEDNESLRLLISHLLGKTYLVTSKANGIEAMCWLKEGNYPDLILLDLEMPEMTGTDFLEGIKTSGFFCDIPVMIISGNSKHQFSNDLILNSQHYIEKPFDPQQLRTKIEQLFKNPLITSI